MDARFAQRFRRIEGVTGERGVDIATLSMDELEALWQEAKRGEGEV